MQFLAEAATCHNIGLPKPADPPLPTMYASEPSLFLQASLSQRRVKSTWLMSPLQPPRFGTLLDTGTGDATTTNQLISCTIPTTSTLRTMPAAEGARMVVMSGDHAEGSRSIRGSRSILSEQGQSRSRSTLSIIRPEPTDE
ncbi:hypothetical protein Aduo_001727 [Ancylostoma duodenale]